MKTSEQYLAEIKEIRKMMEESSRFLSLSGLSGILSGMYALAGAFAACQLINKAGQDITPELVNRLIFIAVLVLVVSFVTIFLLTWRRAKKTGSKIWNPGSRLMALNLAVPLISGGVLLIIFLIRGFYSILSPVCLVFYGLALVNAAKFTRQEIFYMGLLQVILGILAALMPAAGLLIWALGFGLVHIIYGAVMYFRYER